MCLLIGFIIGLFIFYRLYQHFFPSPNINPNGKYVLISGCDSGFGHALAIELDKQGYNILAGVLDEKSIDTVKSELSSKATVFRLDITKQEDIDAAFDLVKDKTPVLHGLVNNAGISISAYTDWMTMETLHKVMNVNFFGHVAMTKKFLPLLIAKRDSRVVNICSVAGYLAMSNVTAYCASKYAFEAFSDCLRREMVPWSLRVSIIEPGFMRTRIIQGDGKSFSEFFDDLPTDVKERWGEDFLKARMIAGRNNLFLKRAEDPNKVVRALQHAVTNTVPCIRYRPGWQSSLIFFPLSTLPAWFVDWFFLKLTKSGRIPAGVAQQKNE